MFTFHAAFTKALARFTLVVCFVATATTSCLGASRAATDDLLTSAAIAGSGTQADVEEWLRIWKATDTRKSHPAVRDTLTAMATRAEIQLGRINPTEVQQRLDSLTTGSVVGLDLFAGIVVGETDIRVRSTTEPPSPVVLGNLKRLLDMGAQPMAVAEALERYLTPHKRVEGATSATELAASLYLAICNDPMADIGTGSGSPIGTGLASLVAKHLNTMDDSQKSQFIYCLAHRNPFLLLANYNAIRPMLVALDREKVLFSLRSGAATVPDYVRPSYSAVVSIVDLDLSSNDKLSTSSQEVLGDSLSLLMERCIEASFGLVGNAVERSDVLWYGRVGHDIAANNPKLRTVPLSDKHRNTLRKAKDVIASGLDLERPDVLRGLLLNPFWNERQP